LGGGVGLLFTYFGINLVRANLTFNDAISAIPLSLDRNVLLFAVALSVLSAVLSGLAPAIKVSRADVNADLKSESRAASSGRSQGRLRTALVTGEITLALFLLIGSCLLIRGVFLLDHQKLGFRTDHVLTAGIALDHARYGDAMKQLVFVQRLIPRLQQIPGVEGVAIASNLPATGAESIPVHAKDKPALSSDEHHSALDVVVTPNYFHLAGISLLRGRTFTEMDDLSATRVVLVNQEFVQRNFHDEDPLGKQIQLDVRDTVRGWSTIVGVVSKVKFYSEETRVDPEIYESVFQRPLASYSLMLRSKMEPNN
jgi:putative ABC transport system permease protein